MRTMVTNNRPNAGVSSGGHLHRVARLAWSKNDPSSSSSSSRGSHFSVLNGDKMLVYALDSGAADAGNRGQPSLLSVCGMLQLPHDAVAVDAERVRDHGCEAHGISRRRSELQDCSPSSSSTFLPPSGDAKDRF